MHVGEKKFRALVNEFGGQETRCPWILWRLWWAVRASQRLARVLLGLSQFGDDFGPAAFRPFFLRYGVIGARKGRVGTIVTRLTAIAPDLPHVNRLLD